MTMSRWFIYTNFSSVDLGNTGINAYCCGVGYFGYELVMAIGTTWWCKGGGIYTSEWDRVYRLLELEDYITPRFQQFGMMAMQRV